MSSPACDPPPSSSRKRRGSKGRPEGERVGVQMTTLPIEPFAVKLGQLKTQLDVRNVVYSNSQPIKTEPHIDYMRGTPFLDVVWEGNPLAVQSMLDQGAPVDEADRFGHTALIVASYRGHEMVVETLLEAGAATDATTGDGWTALHYATQACHIPVVHALLDAGSSPDFRDVNYWTPLHHAAHLGHSDVVHHLLERGADYDALTSGSASPLVLAAAENFRNCALMIASAGGKCFHKYLGKDAYLLSAAYGWMRDLQHYARPPGPPGVPLCVEETLRARSLEIRWAAPVEYSAPVDRYRVEIRRGLGQPPVPQAQIAMERLAAGKLGSDWRPGLAAQLNPNEWKLVADDIPAVTRGRPYSVNTLYPNMRYVFRVTAHSWAGWGEPGAAMRAVRTRLAKPSPPPPPTIVGIPGVHEIAVEWGETMCHGSKIVEYDLQYKLSNNFGVWQSVPPEHKPGPDRQITARTHTVFNLMTRTTYRMRVRARNAFGWGPFSSYSETYETLDDGNILLLQPTCLSTWKRGQRIKVIFRSTMTIKGKVAIDLFKGQANVAELFKGTYPLDTVYNEDEAMYDGEFYWTVPAHAVAGSNYRIKVASTQHTNVFCLSEAFPIVTALAAAAGGTIPSGLYAQRRPEASLALLESDEARMERIEQEMAAAAETVKAQMVEVFKELKEAVAKRAAAKSLREREAMLAERDAKLREQQAADRRRKQLKKA